jgi:chaperonin GroEL
LRELFKSVAVKAPGFGEHRRAILGDIAILTGGQVIEEAGPTLASAGLDKLGRARKVIVTHDDTTIVDAAGDADQIVRRVNQIRAEIDTTASDWEREKLQARLAKIAGGVAVIRVGAVTEEDRAQRKQRLESAVLIARGAVDHGLLPGGGAALVHVQRDVRIGDGLGPSADEATGMAIIVNSLAEPLKRIVANAGRDPAALSNSVAAGEPNSGFDVVADGLSDMLATGIFDTLWVVRQAVANAANLTCRLLELS